MKRYSDLYFLCNSYLCPPVINHIGCEVAVCLQHFSIRAEDGLPYSTSCSRKVFA